MAGGVATCRTRTPRAFGCARRESRAADAPSSCLKLTLVHDALLFVFVAHDLAERPYETRQAGSSVAGWLAVHRKRAVPAWSARADPFLRLATALRLGRTIAVQLGPDPDQQGRRSNVHAPQPAGAKAGGGIIVGAKRAQPRTRDTPRGTR